MIDHTGFFFNLDVHKFDLLQYKQSMGLDLYGTIKLINYIRATVLEQGGEVKEFIIPSDTGVLLNDEKYDLLFGGVHI